MPGSLEDVMQTYSNGRYFTWLVAAAVTTLNIAATRPAAAQPQRVEVRVSVFPDHFVLDNRVIDDLNVLDGAVAAMHPEAIRLDACGNFAERAQMAAAHRFRHLHLELRIRSADSAECASGAVLRKTGSHRRGQPPFGIDDDTVDRWKYDRMP